MIIGSRLGVWTAGETDALEAAGNAILNAAKGSWTVLVVVDIV